MSARERRAKTRKRTSTTVRRITGSSALAAAAAFGLAGPVLGAAEAAIAGSSTQQLTNLNTIAQGSNPQDITSVGGALFYSADSLAAGRELWTSNGTNGVQVADLVNGPQGSYPQDLVNANGHLFFFAQNGAGDEQLWTSTGTAAGTTELTNVAGGLYPAGLFAGTALVNRANNVSFLVPAQNGTQVWTSNGAAAGTNDVALANVLGANDLTAAGGELYFAASGNTANTEGDQFLWASNGSASGTNEVSAANAKANGAYSSVHDLEAVGSNLYFAANGVNGSSSGDQVFGVNDPTVPVVNTSSGPTSTQVTAFAAGTTVSNLASNGTDVFFESQNSANGGALWDGTIGPLGQNPSDTDLTALTLTSANTLPDPYLTNVNGQVYFAAENAAGSTQLWQSNGTANNGTAAVANAGATNVGDLTNVNNALYFTAGNGDGGLWTSNGNASNGTTEVPNSGNLQDIGDLANLGSSPYFSANTAASGAHLWSASSTGVREVDANVDAADNEGSYPTDFTDVGANVFFAANGNNGPGLFVSSGTPGAVTPVVNGLNATDLVNDGGTLAFLGANATSPSPTEQLYFSNGASNGTAVPKLNIGANPQDLTNVGGELYFEANGLTNGTTNQVQIWETNGVQAGTTQLTNFSNAYVMPESGAAIANVGSEAYFVVNADGPAQLYQSNGTVSGTFETNGTSAPSESNITDLTPAGSELYYVTNSSSGQGLWVTNGTAAGTTELLSGAPGAAVPAELTNVNGTLFFREQSTSGYALWSTNGTAAGTHAVKTGIEPLATVADGNGLYFTTYASATNTTSLWQSNGSASGTTVVANIPGTVGGYYGQPNLVNDNGALVFAANDGTHGTELWTSNGTSAGTGLVADIWPGSQSGLYSGSGGGYSAPDFTNDGSTLFFAADDGPDGVEPWVSTGLPAVVAPNGANTGSTTTTTTTTTPTTTTPKPTPTVTTTTPVVTVTTPTPSKKASVARLSRVTASGDALSLTLTCTSGSGNCVSSAKVEIVETIKDHKVVALNAVIDPSRTSRTSKKTIVLASGRISARPGRSGVLKLTLSRSGQKLLSAHKRLKVELVVTQGRRTVAKKAVTLTAPKPKHRTTSAKHSTTRR